MCIVCSGTPITGPGPTPHTVTTFKPPRSLCSSSPSSLPRSLFAPSSSSLPPCLTPRSLASSLARLLAQLRARPRSAHAVVVGGVDALASHAVHCLPVERVVHPEVQVPLVLSARLYSQPPLPHRPNTPTPHKSTHPHPTSQNTHSTSQHTHPTSRSPARTSESNA